MMTLDWLAKMGATWEPRLLAWDFSARTLEELGFTIAVLMTALGLGLQWQVPRKRMEMEELVKDGKVTEQEAKRRVRFFSICAPIATVAGVGMLIGVLLEFA